MLLQYQRLQFDMLYFYESGREASFLERIFLRDLFGSHVRFALRGLER